MEKALRRLDGVAHLEISLQTNLVLIRPAAGVDLPLEEIPRAIRAAGFTPGELTIWTDHLPQSSTLKGAAAGPNAPLPQGLRRFVLEAQGLRELPEGADQSSLKTNKSTLMARSGVARGRIDSPGP